MKKEDLFDRLVENALDFLIRAKSEIQQSPKYSIIHFHAAVELFVKARLMHEHWSLVVKKQEADWEKFVNGDFQSVSLDEAATRLAKVVRSGVSNSELGAFKEVANHRNKMVHFFHEVHTDQENLDVQHHIVKQQLKAWYFLHQLLTVQWRDVFLNWQEKISSIDSELKGLYEFLEVVFENLSAKIKELKHKGFLFEICPSCGFEAQQHDEELKKIYESHCLVCNLSEKCIRVECPECENIVIFREEGFGKCSQCGKKFEPEDLASQIIDDGSAHIAAMEGDDSWAVGNCSECDGYHTVARTENNDWICASCFQKFSSLESCEWCNEPNTGDMSDSYSFGCNFCEGTFGLHKDD